MKVAPMLSITNSLLVMISLFNAGLTVFILRGNTKKSTNVFLAIYFAALCIWPLALIGTQIGPSYDFWFYSAKATYIAGLIIAASFYLFSISFPEELSPSRITVFTTYGLVSLYSLALTFEPAFLVQMIVPQGGGNAAVLEPVAYVTFTGIFCFLYVGGLIRVVRKYLRESGIIRTRLAIIGMAVAITGIGGLYYDIILPSPFLNQFEYIWTGPLFNTITAGLIVYAVFRFGLLNAKVITTEFLIGLLWIFTFLRTLLAEDSQDRFFNGALFVFSLLIGALLVRSVRAEVKAKEDLESANEKLKEVDQMKSEFLSIASHQLRAPITAVRGYASLMVEGDFGPIPEPMREPVERIAESARNMANSIEDYLNISRIEQGRMKYEKSNFDIADLGKKVVEEMTPVAGRRGLALSLEAGGPLMVNADVGKVKQVITNLVDNAIKYTEKGSVVLKVAKEGAAARVTVSDTGMGIPKEEISGLFEKFKRARGANKVNTTGTGLGLYVAKQLVEGHGGKIWAESDGPGKGSRFIFELPL